jgi:hypothetical protein
MSNIRFVEVQRGDEEGFIYYSIGDGDYRPGYAAKQLTVLRDENPENARPREFRSSEINDPEPAPQVELTRQLRDALEELDAENWTVFGLEVAEMIREARAVDPLLRYELLDQVIRWTRDAGWGLDGALKEYDRRLGVVRDFRPHAWIDPRNRVGQQLRPQVKRVLENLPRFQPVANQVRRQEADLFGELGFNVVGTGILLDEPDGPTILTKLETLPEQGVLLVALEGAKDLRRIGEIHQGEPKINHGLRIGVRQGTLVFFCRYNTAHGQASP